MSSPAPLELAGAVPLQRQRSMQSNIMFIQDEHAKTLKALHQEIQRLQTRCSELTFSMAMGTTSSPQEDFYREKADKLQKQLEETTQSLTESTGAIEKRDKRINTLEQQLRAQEKKYQDLLKNKDQQVRQMKAELTDKAAHNAELMLKRLSQSQENPALYRITATGGKEQDLSVSYPNPMVSDPPQSAGSSRGSNSPVPPLQMPRAPHPPREGSGHRRRRTSPRAVVAEGEPQLSSKVKPRAPSGRMLRKNSASEEQVPDPAPFLQRREVPTPRGICPTSTTKFEPLPPIVQRTHHHRTRASVEAQSVAPPQQVQSQAFVPKHKSIHKHKVAAANADHSSGSSSPEVEVLAVDTVIKRDHKLRRAQEYNK